MRLTGHSNPITNLVTNTPLHFYLDWSMFPEELKPKKRRKMGTVLPNLASAKRTGTVEDVLSKLEVWKTSLNTLVFRL